MIMNRIPDRDLPDLSPDELIELSNPLLSSAEQHRDILLEYRQLALQPTMTEPEQDRMGEILAIAVDDSTLNFWITEIDHLIAHHLGLIDPDLIEQQQAHLRQAIEPLWDDSRWQNLENHPKALQSYLQHQGFYKGSIDGVVGPSTEEAIRQFKRQHPNDRLPIPCGS